MPQFEVRKEAARILGDSGDARALEWLLWVPQWEMFEFTEIGSAPNRFSHEVVNAVAAAVVKLGSQHFDQLLSMLQKSNVAPFAAKALGCVGDRPAVPPLVLALKDNNALLSESAAEALGEIKDAGSVDALIDALSRDRGVAVAAGKALQQITGHLGARVGSTSGMEDLVGEESARLMVASLIISKCVTQ